jgi:hypothetical protein
VQELAQKADIYLNSNPNQGALDDWTDEGVYKGRGDFDIMTIRYPINKKSADLGVIIYYRGAQCYVPMNVFTILKKIEANVDPVDFWPDPRWDNDVDNGEGGPVALSKLLDVRATYEAINNPGELKEITLDYWWDKTKVSKPWSTGPYYIFSKDIEDDDWEADYISVTGGYDYRIGGPGQQYAGDNTYVKGYQKYLNNVVKKGPETVTTTKVSVLHQVNLDVLTQWYDSYFWGGLYLNGVLPNAWNYYVSTATKGPFSTPGRNFGPKLNQKKKAKVTVDWVTHY